MSGRKVEKANSFPILQILFFIPTPPQMEGKLLLLGSQARSVSKQIATQYLSVASQFTSSVLCQSQEGREKLRKSNTQDNNEWITTAGRQPTQHLTGFPCLSIIRRPVVTDKWKVQIAVAWEANDPFINTDYGTWMEGGHWLADSRRIIIVITSWHKNVGEKTPVWRYQ